MATLRRVTASFTNAVIVAVVLLAPPAVLLACAANPFPATIEQIHALTRAQEPISIGRVIPFLILAGWVLWLLVAITVLWEWWARVNGLSVPTLPLLRPVQGIAAALVAGHSAGLLIPHGATAAPASPAPARATPAITAAVTLAASVNARADNTQVGNAQVVAAEGSATVLVGDASYTYIVKRGDSLSKIAKGWLGDADRWPEICHLNKHRHFPKVGGTLHNCHLIYPGWDLRLPADARPPADAKPAQAPPPPLPPAEDPDGVTGNPSANPSPSQSPTVTASTPASRHPAASPSVDAVNPSVPATATSAGVSPSASASGTVTASPSDPPNESATAPTADDQGIRLPDGSWVTWTLAAAITAAAALVWLQRRRRFTVDADDDTDPPAELPPPVVQLRRAVAHHPGLTSHLDEAEQAAAVPELAALPPGGIGLRGDGAHAAARAALVAALASGGPHHPERRGEVVIVAATLATLIGSDPVLLGPWPRLHIADDIDEALTIVEAQLLHRSRVIDEHGLSDLDTLREQAPYEEALPPILFVADSPSPGATMRAKVSLALGSGLDLSAILLGEWANGATIDVAADGHTTLLSGHPAEPVPPRLPVLQAASAIHILGTLYEAHTGQTSSAAAAIPLAASRTGEPRAQAEPATSVAATAGAAASSAAGGRKARLCVLGAPRIEAVTQPGRDLRSKARELAVFLACHPDGASTREIGEYLEPDARLSQADQRVHTNASNLRHNLARAGSADAKSAYVVKSTGRYRLDPAAVQVDLWQLRDLLRHVGIATGERRRALLTQACDLYTAPLAEGQDYEWITPHRETARRWGTEAHLLLADDLLESDPQTASNMLDKAIGLDRYNEALYRKAMHARHALGDADGIRILLRALTKAMADLDAEPEEETTTLAAKLRTDLEHQ